MSARRAWPPVAAAIDALVTYRGTALVLVASGTALLAAVLPIAALMDWRGANWGTRLAFPALAAVDLAAEWRHVVQSPAATQQAALGTVFGLLAAAATAVFAVGLITLFAVFAARTAQRETEIAIRRAVGASARVILATALLEGLALAVVTLGSGAALGFPAAAAAVEGWPGTLMDAPPLAMLAVGLGAAGAVLVGALFPVVFAHPRRIAEVPPAPIGLRIPMLQLGLSLIALTSGTVVVRHARELARAAPAGEGGAGQVYALAATAAPEAERAGRYAALLERLTDHTAPGTVSLSSPGTLLGLGTIDVVTTDCGYCPEAGIYIPWHTKPATQHVVSADSFQALGMQVVSGRGFAATDGWGGAPVAVVNRALAAEQFQHGEAIGRKIKVGDRAGDWHTVIGVVDDPRPVGFGAALQPRYAVYVHVLQHPMPALELLVRAPDGGSAARDPEVRRAVATALGSGGGTVAHVTETALRRIQVGPVTWLGRWLAVEAWAMLAIAAVGLAVFMQLWVRSLLAELGLRRAMGARRRQILALVLRRAAGVGLGGTAIGVWFGPAVWSVLRGAMRGLPAWDVRLTVGFAALLVLTALLSALVPAWLAAHRAPAELLATPPG